jgi:anhydro-N-acetylmuramic acid kinase
MVDTLLVDKAIDSERVHQALCDSFLSLQPNESVIQKTIERCDTMMAVVSDTPALYVGSMTGTSMDGLDVALIRTDGKDHVQPLAHVFVPYKPDFQKALKSIEAAAQKSQGDMARVREQCDVDAIITQQAELHIQAVKQLLQQSGHQPEDIKAHGAHGQTVYHEGAILTVQLINAERIAAQTGIPVVHNFRSRDIALGGQGAPLAPVYHVALAKEHRLIPVVFVNCGGISNVTVITSERFEDVTAFDCGPGNVLLDKFVKAKTDGQHQMDKDGTFALAGTANVDMLVKLQACSCRVGGQNYFDLPAPKSLCSHHFTFPEGFDALSLEDGCATLAAFTANIIIESVPENAGLATWVLGGGGWKNPAIRAALDSALEKRFGRVAVKLADEVGLESDALEAGMCAYLAARVGRPISMPKTTGVPWPLAGALITFP